MKHIRLFVPVAFTLLLAACTSSPTVDPIPSSLPPTIDSFTASPPTIANAGDASTLNWSVIGNYSNVQLTDSVSTNAINVAGTSFTVYPSATTTYRLTVSGDSGVATQVTTIALQGTDPTPQPTPEPDPTPEPAKPAITSFSATPSATQPGDPVTLMWAVSGATSLKIDNGVGTVTGTSTTVRPGETTTYKLTATNAGGSVSRNATVTVASESSSTNSSPYGGRWLITFRGPSNESTFVHELNIFGPDNLNGYGTQLLCHEGLTGKLCSESTVADGEGHISPNGAGVDLELCTEYQDACEVVLRANALPLTNGAGERLKAEGSATYFPLGTYDEISGTVGIIRVGNPRELD